MFVKSGKDVAPEKKGHTYRQWMVAILVNLPLFSYGLQSGWISPMTKLLKSEHSPTGSPISDGSLSWIASVMCMAAMAGVPLYAYIVDTWGRRAAIVGIAVAQGLCWATKLMWFTETGLIVARAFAGLAAGGCFNVAPMYVKEIAQDDMRGVLGSLVILCQNMGYFLMYAMGGMMHYETVLWVVMWFPILNVFLIMKAPESPSFLVKKRRLEEAKEAVALLRGLDVEDKEVLHEVDSMSHEQEYFSHLPPVTFCSIFKNKAWSRLFLLMAVVLFLTAGNGVFGIVTFASSVLRSAGVTGVNPDMLTLSFPAVMILSGLVSMSCVEKFGRKPVLLFCQIISALSIGSLAAILLLQSQGVAISSWYALAAIILPVAAFGGGVSPVPYVVLSEVFNFQIRAKVVSAVVALTWFNGFILIGSFAPIANSLGLYSLFFIFACINILGAAVTLVFLPETKGKTIEEIEDKITGE